MCVWPKWNVVIGQVDNTSCIASPEKNFYWCSQIASGARPKDVFRQRVVL